MICDTARKVENLIDEIGKEGDPRYTKKKGYKLEPWQNLAHKMTKFWVAPGFIENDAAPL